MDLNVQEQLIALINKDGEGKQASNEVNTNEHETYFRIFTN